MTVQSFLVFGLVLLYYLLCHGAKLFEALSTTHSFQGTSNRTLESGLESDYDQNGYLGVILFCPCGRKETLSIQIKYVLLLLDYYPELNIEYHIWNIAWERGDREYVRSLSTFHSRVRVLYTPYLDNDVEVYRAGPTASRQFAFIYSQFYLYEAFKRFVFVKLDDDIVFVDVPQFKNFIEYRIVHSPLYQNALKNAHQTSLIDSYPHTENHHRVSTPFLLSANVINSNQTAAPSNFHEVHVAFLNNYVGIINKNRKKNEKDIISYSFEKIGNLSINFVSFLGEDLKYINEEFSNNIGYEDEYRLGYILSERLNRSNEIDLRLTTVHFSYGGNKAIYSHYDFLLQCYETISLNVLPQFQERLRFAVETSDSSTASDSSNSYISENKEQEEL
jgi:hypothetical protein